MQTESQYIIPLFITYKDGTLKESHMVMKADSFERAKRLCENSMAERPEVAFVKAA